MQQIKTKIYHPGQGCRPFPGYFFVATRVKKLHIDFIWNKLYNYDVALKSLAVVFDPLLSAVA
jgi:hypothetical protein